MSVSERVVSIRPHHGLCAQFFAGKGYNEAFVRQMEKTVKVLRGGAWVKLTLCADCLCAACPHNADGVCASLEKAAAYDRRVLAICGMHEGDTMSAADFLRRVREQIIDSGRLRSVCGDCEWAGLCHYDSRP